MKALETEIDEKRVSGLGSGFEEFVEKGIANVKLPRGLETFESTKMRMRIAL